MRLPIQAVVAVVLALALSGRAEAGAKVVAQNTPSKRVGGPPGKGAVPPANAPVANCTLTEILATNEKKGVDPRLKKLEHKLSKPPFNGWDTFKLLGEPALKAEKDKPAGVILATKGKLTLLLKDKLVAQGGKARLRVGIDVDSKEGKRTLSTVMVFGTGEVHFPVAGEPFDKGVYILALSCATP